MSNPSHIPARVAADARDAEASLAALAAVAADPNAVEPVTPPADPVAPAAAAPAAPAAPAPAVQPVAADELRIRLQKMEQDLRTAQGRLERQTEEGARLQGRIDELSRQPAAPAAPAPAPVPIISDKDREDYGQDLLDLIGRVFEEKLGARLSDLSAKVAQMEGRVARVDTGVSQVQQLTAQQRERQYLEQLTSLLPNWEAINEEPELLDWLENRDTLSGKKYAELLADAHTAMQAGRVVNIFQLYKSGNPVSALQPAGPQPNGPETPAPMIDPLTLAAPDTTAAAPAPAAPPAGKLWTMPEVEKLYDDKQKKRISQKVFEQREADYLLAMVEGRVVAA